MTKKEHPELVHSKLMPYKPLVHWLADIEPEKFNALLNVFFFFILLLLLFLFVSFPICFILYSLFLKIGIYQSNVEGIQKRNQIFFPSFA